MGDMNAFERQVAGEVLMASALPRAVDAAAVFAAVTTQSPRWRFQSMFSATKFVVAGVIVALFGGFLLAGVLTQQSEETAPIVGATSSATADEAGSGAVTVSGSRRLLGDHGPGAEPIVGGMAKGRSEGHSDLLMDDPRLTGEFWHGRNWHVFEGAVVDTGTVSLETEDGGWAGTSIGCADCSAARKRLEYAQLTGEGAYEGLSAILYFAELERGAKWHPVHGVIFSGDLPPFPRDEATTYRVDTEGE